MAVVTNIGTGDHLGMNYVETPEQLAAVKQVIVQNVSDLGWAVLNADDALVAEMADACPGAVIFFGSSAHQAIVAQHRAQGGRVVYRDGGDIVAAQGDSERRLELARVPFTRGGTIPFQVENAMAAIAAAWALGVDWAALEPALAGFASDTATAPGRFNLMDYRGATVIADYGHNPDAILALVRAVDAIEARRRVVVISGAGDRRDEDLIRQTEILGDAFDDVILYQDQAQRGRKDGEVLALLRQGLARAKRTTAIEEIRGEFLAIDAALAKLESGDLCLILVDQVPQALAHLDQRLASASAPQPEGVTAGA